ncbi:SPOR domain-containing protein [Arsukibacterium sp.]|uniref:SPOR domain-containing protein n=1 Tax=Arsukibacterium sp. TaxID=1977258 RepID=UPI003566740E
MDTSLLQQKLAELDHLLPSQHELLNRLLFQLAFNDFQNIGLVGAKGSGKSTISLALAELFSDQANVALLTGPLASTEIDALLQQHWFGNHSTTLSLSDLMAEPVTGVLPLLLIVDNFDQLSEQTQQKLLQLDCLGFFLISEPSIRMALNLGINIPTLQDASQVLKDQPLDPLAIAERFATSAGNMHLLHSAVIKPEERKPLSVVLWLLPAVIVLLLLTGIISWLQPASQEQATAETNSKPEIQQDGSAVISPEQINSPEQIKSPELTSSAEQTENIIEDSTNNPELTNSNIVTAATSPELNKRSDVFESPLLTSGQENAHTQPELIAIPAQSAKSEMPTTEPVDTEAQAAVISEPITGSPATNPVEHNGVAAALTSDFRYQEPQLLELPAESRVLQLAVLSSEVALARFMRTYPDIAIAVYQRSWQGQLQWILLAEGHYSDVSSARQARALLAEPLRTAGPFIKPVGQVQQEIKALARLRAESELQE